MILDVARVAGPFVMLVGVALIYVSMRRLRIAMVALRQTCERANPSVVGRGDRVKWPAPDSER